MLVGRCRLRLFSPATVLTFNHHEHWPLRYSRVLSCFGEIIRNGCRNFHDENRLATLNSIAITQGRVLHAMTVEKRTVRRSEIAQVGVGRVHLEQAMMTREVAILGQVEMGLGTAPNQKAVVLGKRKDPAFVRTGCDFQIYLHRGLMIDREIVKCYFMDVAGVEAGAASPEVCSVGNTRQKLAVRIKRQLGAANSNLQLVWSAAGTDRG